MRRYLALTVVLMLVCGGHPGLGLAGDRLQATRPAAVVLPPETSLGVAPPPPSSAVPPGPPPTYWYYCHRPRGYYPQVQRCPGGWIPVVPLRHMHHPHRQA
jgi:hypothetical protein